MMPFVLILLIPTIVSCTSIVSDNYQQAWTQLEAYTIKSLNDLASNYQNDLQIITKKVNITDECEQALNQWAEGIKSLDVESVKRKFD